MRAVIQRVLQGSVSVDAKAVSSIGAGLVVLVGITTDDTGEDMEYIARRILNTRVFEDAAGKPWRASVVDRGLDVLCVSQFTLYAKLKGNKPDFHMAMKNDRSRAFYEDFLALMRKSYPGDHIHDGAFGEHMAVSLVNDGPVTITLDSNARLPVGKPADGGAAAADADSAGAAPKSKSKGAKGSGASASASGEKGKEAPAAPAAPAPDTTPAAAPPESQ